VQEEHSAVAEYTSQQDLKWTGKLKIIVPKCNKCHTMLNMFKLMVHKKMLNTTVFFSSQAVYVIQWIYNVWSLDRVMYRREET
jgi:hypothetical protein